MDRFSELDAFVTVVEAGGFAAAARRTGGTRSSLNRLVLGLEARLGAQLLSRTTRSIAPTSAGRAFYERAKQILDDLTEAEVAVSAEHEEAIGVLRLSAPPSFGMLDFEEIAAAFLLEQPRLRLEIDFDNRFVDPVAEGYDAVIRVAEPDETTSLADHRILTLHYALCASPGYLERQQAPLAPKELGDHDILHLGGRERSRSWLLSRDGVAETVAFVPKVESNSLQMTLRSALAGDGIAQLPIYAIRDDLRLGRLVRVLEDYAPPARSLQFVYAPARHLSASVQLFGAFLEAWCVGDDPGATSPLTSHSK